MISIQNKTTGAIMDSVEQCFFNNLSASRAYFARVARINKYHGSTSFFRFVGRELYELVPRYVANAFVKFASKTLGMIAHHVFDVELFKGNDLVLIHYLPGKLVSKVSSFICYFLMETNKIVASLLPVGIFHLHFTQSSLCLYKLGFVCREETRIANFFASGKSNERGKANINTNNGFNLWQRFRFDLARKTGIPFGVNASNRQCFNFAGYFPMPFHHYATDLSNFELISGNGKTTLRKRETIIPVETLESWIARCLTCFHSAKEEAKSKIDSHRNILKALRIGIVEKGIFFLPFSQKIACIIPRDRLFAFFPRLLSNCKRFIVCPPASIKGFLQRLLLFCRRIQSELKGLTHGIILTFPCVNVKNYFKERAHLISAT